MQKPSSVGGNITKRLQCIFHVNDTYIRVTEHVNVMLPWPTAEVVWVVSPPVNSTGSSVALTFTNATADTVYLPGAQHWWIEDLDGNLVFQPVSTLAIVPVPPAATVPGRAT